MDVLFKVKTKDMQNAEEDELDEVLEILLHLKIQKSSSLIPLRSVTMWKNTTIERAPEAMHGSHAMVEYDHHHSGT